MVAWCLCQLHDHNCLTTARYFQTMLWQLRLSNLKGLAAERKALRFLKAQGLKPVTKNYACKFGEIDLIMLCGETLVFIEVRYRSSVSFGSVAGTINRQKQDKIRKTAEIFRLNNPKHHFRLCRFDAIAIYDNDSDPQNSLEWIKSAF